MNGDLLCFASIKDQICNRALEPIRKKYKELGGMSGQMMDQLQSDDMLLFATDFPHWQFDGDAMLPAGIPPALRRKILIDNPLATYPRLGRPA